MPTGYTDSVQDGKITEVKDFILNCSKGFGAFIHMRDDNLSPEIKYQEVGDYYPRKLESVKRELEEFEKLSDEEIQNRLDKSYQDKIEQQKKSLADFDKRKKRYLVMLEKVATWIPPTEDHMKLKEFALEQLNNSIELECSDRSREYYLQEPYKYTLEEYKNTMIKGFLKNIEYYSKSYREEIERVENANKWIKDLVESFNE